MSLDATAKFRLSRDYYERLHADWLRHVSRWRRYSMLAGYGSVFIAAVAILVSAQNLPLGLAFAAVGVFWIVQHAQHRARWLRARMRERTFDQPVTIRFTDSRIEIAGPQGSGFCAWDSFERSLITRRGLFLWPRKGVHIYIPDDALEPVEAKAEIAEKVGAQTAAARPSPHSTQSG